MNLRSDRENSASPKTPISGVRFLVLESVYLFKYCIQLAHSGKYEGTKKQQPLRSGVAAVESI